MSDFLLFIDDLAKRFPIHVNITYSKTCDWTIEVYKRGMADCFPKSPRRGEDAMLCNVQEHDMELAFAKAHCEVKEWMMENNGGY